MYYRRCAFIFSFLFLGGLFIGCEKNQTTHPSDGNERDTLYTKTTCDDFAEIQRGKYILANNVWGKADITDYEQCIFYNELRSGYQFGWQWNWPSTGDWNWTYLAFILNSSEDIDSVPLHEFVNYLIDNNHVSADDYLASIEFGNEIVSGTGDTVVRDFSITVY